MPGSLHVVATPIGNLEDLTFRALRILGEVDVIAAEDTRRTSKLLAHYGIRTPLLSYREHNEARQTPLLIARLEAGESIALVSDAGTPGIADPGARLVRAALDKGIRVVPIPGPSAVTAALSASGLSGDQFVFLGFPPATGAARRRWFERLNKEALTVVLFESPHRIARTLGDLSSLAGRRPIIVFREFTKIHETSIVSPNHIGADEVHTNLPQKGEFVVVVGPAVESAVSVEDPATVLRVFSALDQASDIDEADAFALTARLVESDERSVRKIVKKHRIWVKQQKSAPS